MGRNLYSTLRRSPPEEAVKIKPIKRLMEDAIMLNRRVHLLTLPILFCILSACRGETAVAPTPPVTVVPSEDQFDLALSRENDFVGTLSLGVEVNSVYIAESSARLPEGGQEMISSLIVSVDIVFENITQTIITLQKPLRARLGGYSNVLLIIETVNGTPVGTAVSLPGVSTLADSPDDYIVLKPGDIISMKCEVDMPYFADGNDYFPPPPGEYLIHASYMNIRVGYTLPDGNIADMNAWVGRQESNKAFLEIADYGQLRYPIVSNFRSTCEYVLP